MPNRKPWVQSSQDLDALEINGDGRTVLTHPDVHRHGHRIAELDDAAWKHGASVTDITGLGTALALTAAELYSAGLAVSSWDEPELLDPQDLEGRLSLTAASPEPAVKPDIVGANGTARSTRGS
jgi:hypothetical protein